MKEVKQFCVVFTEDELEYLRQHSPQGAVVMDYNSEVCDGIYNALANAQRFESLWVDEDELD